MTPGFNRHRHSEEAFLFVSFYEFVKCWSSGKRSRLFIESVNGHAFVNFSAFLGYPKDDHFMPQARDRQSKPKKKKKKSQRKIQRDNARAAEFQERKRRDRERALISLPDISFMTGEGASLGNPNNPTTSSPSMAGAASAPINFHFSKPRPENVRDSSETLMHTSLYFSRLEEETQSRDVESSSITDHHPVTREEESVLETERTQWESSGLPTLPSDKDREYYEDRMDLVKLMIGPERRPIDIVYEHHLTFLPDDFVRHHYKSRRIRKEIRKRRKIL